jgi:hypothetical protein
MVLAIATISPGRLPAADDTQSDPHWNKSTCGTCHLNAMPVPGNIALRAERAEKLCESCHGSQGNARSCRHSSEIPVGAQPLLESYRDAVQDGQIVCTTCHDLTVQCLSPHKAYRFVNPGFVRDRSSADTNEHCFACHDESGYKKLNPHEMEAGDPAEPTCLLCHASMPVADERGWLAVDFNMPNTLNDACRGCHNVRPHPGMSSAGKPGGWSHLAVPSLEVRRNMQLAAAKYGSVLPLDPYNGRVHCATCHNPHHDELEGYPVATPPGAEHRLRVDNICQACHDL